MSYDRKEICSPPRGRSRRDDRAGAGVAVGQTGGTEGGHRNARVVNRRVNQRPVRAFVRAKRFGAHAARASITPPFNDVPAAAPRSFIGLAAARRTYPGGGGEYDFGPPRHLYGRMLIFNKYDW